MRHIDPDIMVGRKRMPAGYRFITPNYDKFQLVLVHKGILGMRVYKRDTQLHPGSVALLRQGSAFELWSREGYSGLGIQVEKPELPELKGECRILQTNIQMRNAADLIEHYLLTPNTESRHTIRNLARAVIWQTVDAEKRQLEKHKEKWPEIAKGVLDADMGTGMPARKALSHIPLCYRQLSRLFKAAYGMSPKQYQLEARIAEAKRMLSASSASVTETAMELGFSSSQHFATQFRDFTGMTPRDFAAQG